MMRRVGIICLLAMLAGCETVNQSVSEMLDGMNEYEPEVVVDAKPVEPEWVRATGYAPISLQPGQNREHKMIKAMRASKLRAYQELTAIVHGQYLFGTTAVRDMIVQSDNFKTAVSGIVRGARVVKSYPVQEDVYATILEVDLNQIQKARVNASPQ